MNQKRLLPITEYFAMCEVHGEMNFTQKVNKKNWKCEQKECKNEREYLTQEEFLKMLTDSLYEVDTYDDAHYELVFFSQLLYVDIEIIYEILFSNDLNNIKNWKEIFSFINTECEKIIKSKNQEEEQKLQLQKYLDNKKRENFRICLLCGTSNCKTINSCMVTSD